MRLSQKLDTFTDNWSPKIVSTFSGYDAMAVKVKGKFVWHSHEDTDASFLALKGHTAAAEAI